MSKSDTVIEKLKGLGYTDEKLQELLPLVFDDVEEIIAFDFATVSTDAETAVYTAKIQQAKTAEEVKAVLIEMSRKAYGEAYEQKFDEILATELEKVAEMTSNIRQTYHKYMSGDPDTVAKINAAQNSPDVQATLSDMQASGFDFINQATK